MIFNIRNFIRISKEVNQYGYEPLKNFFYVPQVKSKIITHMDELNIYAPKIICVGQAKHHARIITT